MKTLTSKIVKTGIKNGFTVHDFCKKYDIKGETNFVIQLEKAFPRGGSEQMLRDIRQNEKNRRHASSKPSATPIRKGVDKVEKKENTLEILKATETTLSNEVVELENQHKELRAQRQNYSQKLIVLQKKVDEIYSELEKQEAICEELIRLSNEAAVKMNELSKTHAEKQDKLTSIRNEITKLETSIIAVYEDCSFEVVEGLKVSLDTDESKVNNLTHQLMEKDICENLTVKQIRTLARLLTISKTVSHKLEFIFDSSELERAYLASKPLSP